MASKMFCFQIHTFDFEPLVPQTARALEKRMEIVSRIKYPWLWKGIDAIGSFRRTDDARRPPVRARATSILCLALGLVLLVPALMRPGEMIVPLLAGALAVFAGIGGLLGGGQHTQERFEKSARLLLEGVQDALQGRPACVCFSEEGMAMSLGGEKGECVPYSRFECVVETEDAFLFVYGSRAMMLRKQDLAGGASSGMFCCFVQEKVARYSHI